MYVTLAGVVLFFALTRTQVGRDGIRQQIESAFNERFAGSLHIGSLEGTLVNDLYAADVRLEDAEGRLVAHIDSVATEPHWSHLFTAQLSVRSLTLVRPQVKLHRNAEGTWNLDRALRRHARSTDGRSLDFSLANIVIQDGRIRTSRDGPPPRAVENRWLFDYSRSELTQLNAEATVEWNETGRNVHVENLDFELPGKNLELSSARGTLVEGPSRWRLDTVTLGLGRSNVTLKGTVEPSPRAPTESVLDLQIGKSRLDHDELRRLIPRSPFHRSVTVEGRMGGSLDRLVVNTLTVAHDQSSLTLEGTAFGLPDSLDVDAQLLQSQVRPSDVQAVWPEAPLGQVDSIGLVHTEATLRGLVQWRDRPQPTFELESTVSARGTPGAVRGSLDVRRAAATPLEYTGQFRVDSLNLAPIRGQGHLASSLTGRVDVHGTGKSLSTLQGEINGSLSASHLNNQRIAAADFHVTANRGRAQGEARIQQPTEGEISLRGEYDATGDSPLYTAGASATKFDLSGAHDSFPSTSLNASLSVQGRGDAWNTLAGSLQIDVDSSSIHRADSTIHVPSHRVTLDVADPSSSEPRLQLGGTVATASVGGSPLHPSIRTSGRLWGQTLHRSLQQAYADAARGDADSTVSVPSFPASLQDQVEEQVAGTELTAPLHLRGELDILRMDLVRAWWPASPRRATDFHASISLTLGPDTLDASGTLTASRLHTGTHRLDSLDVSYGLAAPLQPNLLDTLSASLSARADTFQTERRTLVAPSARIALSQRKGTFEAEADGLGRTGPFRLTSDILVEDAPTFRITDLYVGAGQHAWMTKTPGTVSIHSSALVIDSLGLASSRPLAESTQQIQLHGTVSSAPSDTLYAEMNDVLLYPMGELASLSKPVGGRLNGRVAMTGGWAQPKVESSFEIHRLTFDRRVLGTLRVQSRLTPDSPDLRVNAALEPGPSSIDSLSGPPLIPQGPQTIEENRLQVAGRVRLPGWAEETDLSTSTPEQLDVTVNVQRADLFFFKYIFDENLAQARGYTAGTIEVGGHFRHPVFNADLDIVNGHFTLPQFGLAYTANGPVQVDREGIHLQDLRVEDSQGSATLQGSVLFNEYRYFSFNLSAELNELTIVDVTDAEDLAFYGQIRASGPASLTGPLQNATLRSNGARTTPDSELFIPVSEGGVDDGTGFIVFADSTGQIPDLSTLTRRDNIFSDRPAGEPSFLEGLEIDINVLAPEESTVNLVFDPIVGDVVTAVGSGRIQLQRQEGEFFVYGNFNVTGGTYLFTAGEVFVRRFDINEGTITWDGPPTNAQLALNAEYRTRASPAGLPGSRRDEGRIPVRVQLDIGGRVETPRVDLSLARARDERNNMVGSQTLDAILNQPDRTTEYATSVLLTNTFLLTTESFTQGPNAGTGGNTTGSLADAGNQLAFNSVSQLVASQLNRYLGAALPNVDLNVGVQGEAPNDLDLIYGVALRLLNERLVIRGEGVYTGDETDGRQARGAQGEFVVEVRLSNRVSVEAFYRRAGDELTRGQTLTSSTGAGVSYQTEFPTWRQLFGRVFGWLLPGTDRPVDEEESAPDPVAQREESGDEEEDSGDEASGTQD